MERVGSGRGPENVRGMSEHVLMDYVLPDDVLLELENVLDLVLVAHVGVDDDSREDCDETV